MTATTGEEKICSRESSPGSTSSEESVEDLVAQVISGASAKPTLKEAASLQEKTEVVKATANKDSSSSKGKGKIESEPLQKSINNSKTAHNVEKPVVKEKYSDTIEVLTLPGTSNNSPDVSSADLPYYVEATDNEASRASDAATKKPIKKPSPISTTVASDETQTQALKKPLTPTKRPSASTNDHVLDPKRAKMTTSRETPSYTRLNSQHTTSSPSPAPLSIDRQVAEQRKRLEELRKRRKQVAEKQTNIDKEMEPFMKRMAEESERLNQQLMDEESAYLEEEQHYNASLEMLKSFKEGDGGKWIILGHVTEWGGPDGSSRWSHWNLELGWSTSE